MQTMRPSLLKFLLAIAISLITAISIGGVGQGGTGGRAASFGRIIDFGSIWVNGVEFFTDSASITIDNIPGQPESALKAGMVVKVNGDLAPDALSGVATSVVHNTDLRGAVDASPAVTSDGYAFSVHGLAVRSDSRTIIAGAASVGLLTSGQRIIVSGLSESAGGALRASRIDVLPVGASGSVLRGVASAVSGMRFNLGAAAVDGTTASLHFVTWAEIASGAEVRVRSVANVAGGVLIANTIERAESLAGQLQVGFEAEVEGVASSVAAGQFTLNGVSVATSAVTVFENGNAADLVNGASIEVKGRALTASSISAQRIKFASPEAIDALAKVVSKTATSLTLFSAANNVVFTVNAATTYKDSSNARISNFTVGQIAVGDTLKARGLVRNGSSVATRIERIKPAADFTLKTRMFEAQSGALVLENAIISTNAATLYVDVNGVAMSQAAFLSRAIGLRVDARGTVNGNVLMATSVAIN